jgi:uncharacterized protein YecE (DUF72 family)
MEDPQQIKLFEEDAGEISPPEEDLYLGTSGWSYADWEGTLYPPGTTPTGRLVEYVKHFATVEIDSTFYGTPRGATVERWRKVAPRGFLFAAKFPQDITHERNLVGCKEAAESFVRTLQALEDRLGPLLLQLPPDFTVEGMEVLDAFLRELPEGPRYAVDPRMPRLEEATAGFSYIRWLGNRREFPSGHTRLKKDRDEDLLWWSGLVDRFLGEGKTVFAYANNHYQNHSPSTVERFLEIRRGERSQ